MNSAKVLILESAPITNTFGIIAIREIGVKSLRKSYGSDLYNEILATKLLGAINSVYPSGADCAATLAPMLPPAPARFSTTTCCPSRFERCSAISLAVMSVLPPGAYGTTSVIGLFG